MNVLAIADLFLPGHVMRAALSALQPTRLDVIEWPSKDLSELHHRVRHIERHGPEAEPPPEAVWRCAGGAELIVTHMCPIGEKLIESASKLRMIGVCRAGTETIACRAARSRGIAVYNVPGRNAVAVAEFTVGLMLAERRNIARAHQAIAAGAWRKTFWKNEPIDADSPLRRLDNVTLTPHLAGSTREAFHRSPALLVQIIRREMEL